VEIKDNVCKCEKDYSTEISNNSFGIKEVNSPTAVNLDTVPVESGGIDEVLESFEPPLKKKKLSVSDVEDVIMGEELSDIHINLAHNLLKGQFPKLCGLHST